MTRLGAEAWLAAAAIWLSIMLPSAAFGFSAGDAAPAVPADHLVRPL